MDFLKIIAIVLKAVMSVLSPQIKILLAQLVNSLYEAAKKTDNEVDDIFVGLLASVLSIPLTK